MKYILFLFSTCLLTACGALPQLLSEAEHVVDDTAVEIKVSQEALRKVTNVTARVDVTNDKTN